MIKDTICLAVIIICLAISVRISGIDTDCILKSISGLLDAAKDEIKSRAGKTGKANLILSVLLAAVCLLLCVPDVLQEVREVISGVPESRTFQIVLFIALSVFFLLSLCLVRANEEFLRNTRRRN